MGWPITSGPASNSVGLRATKTFVTIKEHKYSSSEIGEKLMSYSKNAVMLLKCRSRFSYKVAENAEVGGHSTAGL